MPARTTASGETAEGVPRFRLTEGGPGAGLLRHLSIDLSRRRVRVACILAAVTWVPLLILSAHQGSLLEPAGGAFLHDLTTHVRLLVALPALVLATSPIGAGQVAALAHFVEAGLVGPDDRHKFVELIHDTQRLRDARLAGLLVFVAAGATTWILLDTHALHGAGAWLIPEAQETRTTAGQWYAFVSLPILQFLWIRWLFLLGVWARLLRRISRLDLRLDPAHPDGAGGLGFLGECSVPFGLLLFAASSVLAADGVRRSVFASANHAALFVVALAVFIGPLLVFRPALDALRRRGALEYGALASRYAQLFASKWVERAGVRDGLLGTPDIQSLADLAATYDRARSVRLLPLMRRDIVAMALPGLIPLVILALTIMPLREILRGLLRLLA